MFIGHFAVAMAGKRVAPRMSLGTLVLGAQWLDLLWPWLVYFGWERVRVDPGNTRYTPLDFQSYPISHSLAAVMGWALLLGLIYFGFRKSARGAVVLGGAVLSHWILDWLTHRPDLPLYPGGPKAGLGLWNSVPGTMLVEGAMFLAGILLYIRTTRSRDRIGTYSLAGFIAFLALIWVGNSFGPPPRGTQDVVWAGIGMVLMVVWAYWIDRHRIVRQ